VAAWLKDRTAFQAYRVGERSPEIPHRVRQDTRILSRSLAGGGAARVSAVAARFNQGSPEREGNRVFLRRNSYDVAADPGRDQPGGGCDALRWHHRAFNVEAWGPTAP
jgi:hypothetical protein